MCNEEPRELQENRDMLSNFVMIARVTGVRSALPRYIVELVEIICTSMKSLFCVDSAVESHTCALERLECAVESHT